MAGVVPAHSLTDRGGGDMEFCVIINIWGVGMERDRSHHVAYSGWGICGPLASVSLVLRL